ncbi:Annexin B9 [Armadillidium vulgare]|nr:Annexin B9 [Armadillidium vulgare]
MCTYYEVWKFWYEAQLKELDYNREFYSSGKPTLRPASHFDPAEDAEVLRKAMKGLGTNEKDITRILTRRSLNQRTKIQEKYQQIHGRDLVKDLEKELSGIFEKVILSLMKPLPLFFAEQLKNATKELSKKLLKRNTTNPLKRIVCKETGGQFEKLLMSILSFCRDDSASSPSAVADELTSDDIKEDDIRRIVTSYTFRFLKKVFEEYQDKTGEEFEKLVDKKCKGDSKKAFKAIYLISKNRIEYYAHALNEAMKGRGTDDWALIRIIVSRCEIDLGTIKDKYNELYGKDLIEQVKKELSGDYEKALVNLLGGDE